MSNEKEPSTADEKKTSTAESIFKFIMFCVLIICLEQVRSCTDKIFSSDNKETPSISSNKQISSNKPIPEITPVDKEILKMKIEAKGMAVSLEPSVAKCFISFVEKAVEDQEFKRRLKICVETEKVLSNKAINMSRAADLAKCHSLRIKVINDGLEAGKKCETRYESKIDW